MGCFFSKFDMEEVEPQKVQTHVPLIDPQLKISKLIVKELVSSWNVGKTSGKIASISSCERCYFTNSQYVVEHMRKLDICVHLEKQVYVPSYDIDRMPNADIEYTLAKPPDNEIVIDQ